MTSSNTRTNTFTVSDVRKVIENFVADFYMIASTTELRTVENVGKVVSDLRVFAENQLLEKVSLILKDKEGQQIKAAVYKISTSANGWSNDRPGNNLWPQTPGGALSVIASLSNAWWDKSDAQRTEFRQKHSLNFAWGVTSEDTSFANLKSNAGQQYASNGYGWERTNYSI